MLEKDEDLRPVLQFVAVKPGDYFEIEPGVPHAIGPGLVLLEPQRILSVKAEKPIVFGIGVVATMSMGAWIS